MIKPINSNIQKTHFTGTTIIKNKGLPFVSDFLKESIKDTKQGCVFSHKDTNLLIMGDVFKIDEKDLLKKLDARKIDYVHSSKVLNYKKLNLDGIADLITSITKSGLL